MNIAVLGYGAMGINHTRVLRRLGHRVLTVDPAGHAHYTAIPKRDFADGAVIATPAEHIPAAVKSCEDVDLPILLIEKPLAATVAEASVLAMRLPGTWVGYVERFNPVLPVVEELLPTLGEIRAIKVRRLGLEQRNNLGAYRDLATHDLDLLDALRLPIERAEFEVGYGVNKVRTWDIHGTDTSLSVDWQHQRITADACPAFEQGEPLTLQWLSILRRDKAPVDARLAVQVLRLAVRLEQELEPVAA